MKTEPYPLAMPSDLLREMRKLAKESGLSIADTMRQSMKLGAPLLRQLVGGRVTNVDPLSEDRAQALYSQPDDDTDGIKVFMAAQAIKAEDE